MKKLVTLTAALCLFASFSVNASTDQFWKKKKVKQTNTTSQSVPLTEGTKDTFADPLTPSTAEKTKIEPILDTSFKTLNKKIQVLNKKWDKKLKAVTTQNAVQKRYFEAKIVRLEASQAATRLVIKNHATSLTKKGESIKSIKKNVSLIQSKISSLIWFGIGGFVTLMIIVFYFRRRNS